MIIDLRPWQLKLLAFLGLPFALLYGVGAFASLFKGTTLDGMWPWLDRLTSLMFGLLALYWISKLVLILLSVQRVTLDPAKDHFCWQEWSPLRWRSESGEYREMAEIEVRRTGERFFTSELPRHEVWLLNRDVGWQFRVSKHWSGKDAQRQRDELAEAVGLPPIPLWKKRQGSNRAE